MPEVVAYIGSKGSAKHSRPHTHPPRVLITGCCRGVGRACAEELAGRGADLILCDLDRAELENVAREYNPAGHFFCDVASEASVAGVTAQVLDQYPSLDMVINAAGGGYERTLGMYRVSRALLPALRLGTHKLLVNVPPAPQDADAPTFPYASSRLAFQRLSSALAFEVRGTSVAVLIACPDRRQLMHVFPDPNAGTWAESCGVRRPSREDAMTMAWQVASLIDGDPASHRQAG